MYKKIIERHKRKFNVRRNSSAIVLFSHIPKTAGTSFRKSIEKKNLVIKDYGVNSDETSEVVKKFIYKENEPYFLKVSPLLKRANWLCGHFPLSKYIDLVDVSRTISFVREPVEQVISHYNHHVAYKNYKGKLDEFIENESWHNMQSKYLNIMPISLLGCVGVTEYFNDTLKIVNEHFGLSIEEESHNVNTKKAVLLENIDEILLNKIKKYNDLDYQLYEEANRILNQRLVFFEQSKLSMWVFGTVDRHIGNILYGCAFFAKSNDVVELNVLKNSKVIAEIKANQYFTKYTKANFPRERYIGFYFTLPSNSLAGDEFDIIVKKTGQKINNKTFRIE